MTVRIPDPTWSRLGFFDPPDFMTAGQNVGIVIIDTIKPHHTIRHLGPRIKYVSVHEDLSVTSRDIAFEDQSEDDGDNGRDAHVPFSDEPYGRNGNGHPRPDVLAPRVYLTIPFCEMKLNADKV